MKIKDRAKPSLPPVPGGTYMAVCVYSIDIGEQLCEFKDKGKSYNNQVMLGFELAGVTIEIDGKQEPRTLGRTFNVAKGKNAALRKFVSAWNAKEYSDEEFMEMDTNELVEKPAMLNVVLNESGEYSNIESIMQVPVGFSVPQATVPLIRFDMEPWDQKAFEALPEWAQERIKKSTQYQKEHAPNETVAVKPAAAPQNGPAIDFAAMAAQMAQMQAAGIVAPSGSEPAQQPAPNGTAVTPF